MLIFIIQSIICFAQGNLDPNNSFENHTNLVGHRPNNFGQFDVTFGGVDRWKKAGLTSPDWFTSREPSFLGFANGNYVQPATGTEYAGISPFEGIEVRIANGLVDKTPRCRMTSLVFWDEMTYK